MHYEDAYMIVWHGSKGKFTTFSQVKQSTFIVFPEMSLLLPAEIIPFVKRKRAGIYQSNFFCTEEFLLFISDKHMIKNIK